MRIDTLGDLLERGSEDEKKFVKNLLLAYAKGGPFTDDVWKRAAKDWRDAVRLEQANGSEDPEQSAMESLTILLFADRRT